MKTPKEMLRMYREAKALDAIKNPKDFCERMAAEHNTKVAANAQKIYEAYISMGATISEATTRQQVYIQKNSKTWKDFE